MKIVRGIEWRRGIEGSLVLGESERETRAAGEFLDYIQSCDTTFDTADYERIGSCAYFVAICEVRSTTAGFVLAAADQIIENHPLVSSDDTCGPALRVGASRVREYLMRIRAKPGGTLADAAMGYLKLLTKK